MRSIYSRLACPCASVEAVASAPFSLGQANGRLGLWPMHMACTSRAAIDWIERRVSVASRQSNQADPSVACMTLARLS
jgi:hypothetical protein